MVAPALFPRDPRRGPLIMGIMNMTPDSFSGDGLLKGDAYAEAALLQAIQMVVDGADILDIGGESTRPGGTSVPAAEELRRVMPIVEALHDKLPELPLSVDTMKPEVAKEVLKAGATILNDISGSAQQPTMRRQAAENGAYLVLMHNRAQADAVAHEAVLGGEYQAPAYGDVVQDVVRDCESFAETALQDGVAKDRIWLDPGIGFGKTAQQNMQLINRLDRLVALGFPVLLAASRKSFIGRVLDLPPEERLEGTAAALAIGTLRGAAILRVHDVRAMARVAKMASAVASA